MAIDPEEMQVPAAPGKPKPKDLEPLSIEELQDYIGEMEMEIERVRGAIAAKREQRDSAETFFKR